MPVKLKDNAVTTHVNPTLVNGEVYRIVDGYGEGRVFVVFQRSVGVKGVQYLGSNLHNGWDLVSAVTDSQFVKITLQEV